MPYTILLPLDHRKAVDDRLARFAVYLTERWQGELVALSVLDPDEESTPLPFPSAIIQSLADEGRFRYLTRHGDDVAQTIMEVATEEAAQLILVPWVAPPTSLRHRLGHILDPLMAEAPCDVIVMKPGREITPRADAPHRLLIPLARRSPHGVAAIQHGLALARADDTEIEALTVVAPSASEEDVREAEQELRKLFATVRGASEQTIHYRVVRASNAERVIETAAQESDLVILGATNDPILAQIRLGSTGERLTHLLDQPILIARHHSVRYAAWRYRWWHALDRRLPNLTQAERLDTYKRIRRGARANNDFYILLVCSVVIATMGLLLNSAAVIIGAMVVAPLMTPIVGIGLSIVMGDMKLLRLTTLTAAKGIALSIAVAALLAWVAPLVLFTSEIQARTHPNLMDLTVALAAGVAGAYSLTRSNGSGTLPGVAIAVALVPPLGVVGISLATMRWEAAMGAMLLFGTNLVAIAFAAALVYFLLGFFPIDTKHPERVDLLWRGVAGILVLLFLVSIPLARSLERSTNEAAIQRTLDTTLREATQEGRLTLFNFTWDTSDSGIIRVRVVAYAVDDVQAEDRQQLEVAASQAVGKPVELRLWVIPISELKQEAP